MSVIFRAFTLACVSFSLTCPAFADESPAQRPQYVIISFDGAHELAQWQRSRSLAARTGARFTYFLSCVFLLSRENRNEYHAPGKSAGRSNVGFAQSKDEVRQRLAQIWLAHSEGHDIASHACGHFDGKDWTKADWLNEFSSFSRIVRDAYKINGIEGEPEGWKQFAETGISGFRVPYLSDGKALYSALSEKNFAYDASGISRGPAEPQMVDGMMRFALPQIPEGPQKRPIIAMDYNLFVRHSGGIERKDADGAFENRAYEAFRAAFDREYDGKRVPLGMGFHFTLMNGGAYWRALERFAGEVCVKADVKCVSYADYLADQRAAGKTQTGNVGG
ncbi:polysaccharide deacetylase family protein [Pseudaminobacter soli (ex Li et al. 2025)]|uniref:Polysaccharide deacetylase n=1 Tax=Pseudaminobacter soli (ex Li et al. 2025) TaxID=1295366 RepID=A0A2P7SG74_9HYPH|nr:polysaccharide deacetylase [Mesorhizobium soli]PSJ61492.1 polysaccharide deacetylase [Mesorhizobium soli]